VTCIKFLEEDPTNFEARLRLGMIYMEVKKKIFKKVLNLLKERNLFEAKEAFLECLKIKNKPEEDYDNVYTLLSNL